MKYHDDPIQPPTHSLHKQNRVDPGQHEHSLIKGQGKGQKREGNDLEMELSGMDKI